MKKIVIALLVFIFMMGMSYWLYTQKNSDFGKGTIMIDHTSISVNDYEKS